MRSRQERQADQAGTTALPRRRPEHVSVERLEDGVRVRWGWHTPGANFLALVSLIWNIFFGLLLWGALAGGAGLFSLVVAAPLVLGAGLAYIALAMFLNRTTVLIRDGRLTVRHRPLPWPGQRTLPLAAIRQLSSGAREYRTTHRRRVITSTRYELRATTADGEAQPVATTLTSMEDAIYVRHVLTQALQPTSRLGRGARSKQRARI